MARIDSTALRAAVQRFAEQVVEGTASRALDTVRSGVPRGESGELASSEFNRTAGTHLSIGYDAEHATYTDEGTRPHPIYGNPYLAWDGADGRVIIIADRTPVQHPGTPRLGWWSDVIGDEGSLDGLIEIANEVAGVLTEFA